MSEIKSWDTVFYVKETGQNIGIRVYYFVEPNEGIIEYQGQTKEFGNLSSSYVDNPGKGDVTTFTYEFKVVVSKSYFKNDDSSQKCIDIKVEVFKKTSIKSPKGDSSITTQLEDENEHKTTECVDCIKNN